MRKTEFQSPLVRWIDTRLPVFTLMQKEYGSFPTPRNFNYLWNFGALATVTLAIMIVSGVFLAMDYQPNTQMAFDSVQRIMRDVNYGWMIRYIHLNGASMFFIAVYVHIYRGMYYGSYKAPRELLWILGVILLLLMMATAFTGYVLPWSQMSYWGATVITSLFSAIPVFGDRIVTWLWGGFSIGNPTLNSFFNLHYLLPFIIVGVVFLHVWALHITGSNNPLGILQLSIYTMQGNGFTEVVINPETDAIVKAETITDPDDLAAATRQKKAAADTSVSLLSATWLAVKANSGFEAVRVVPELTGDGPVAQVTLLRGDTFKTISEKLNR